MLVPPLACAVRVPNCCAYVLYAFSRSRHFAQLFAFFCFLPEASIRHGGWCPCKALGRVFQHSFTVQKEFAVASVAGSWLSEAWKRCLREESRSASALHQSSGAECGSSGKNARMERAGVPGYRPLRSGGLSVELMLVAVCVYCCSLVVGSLEQACPGGKTL